jgi:hypothetical protein
MYERVRPTLRMYEFLIVKLWMYLAMYEWVRP